MPKVSPEMARDAWLELKTKNPAKSPATQEQNKENLKNNKKEKPLTPRQRIALATEALNGAINKGDLLAFNNALTEGAQIHEGIFLEIIEKENPILLKALFDHSVGQTFIQGQKNPKLFARHLYDALTKIDRDSQACLEMCQILLEKKMEPTPDWQTYFILQEEMQYIDNPFKRWWVEQGVFEHQWILKKDLHSYLVKEMLPFLACSPDELTLFLKRLEKNAPHEMVQLKDKKVASMIWASALHNGAYENSPSIQATCNALIDADILPSLHVTATAEMGCYYQSIKGKTVSWPMLCALRNEEDGFNFFIKSKKMKELLHEDIQKMSMSLLDMNFFPRLLTPQLIASGYDFTFKNNKRRNVFHLLFRDDRISLTKALDEVVRANAKVLLSQKDTKGRTCFEAWKENSDEEAKISIGGSKLIPISSYKAIIEKSLLSQSIAEAPTTPKPSSKKRL